MEKKSYDTAGRRKLLSFFAENPDRQFTTEEICVLVNGDAERGKSSVYRRLMRLCEEDVLRKFRSEERNCSVYQYVGEGCDCRSHFHGKCTVCGELCHLDCHDSMAFAEHLMKEHGFMIDCGQSILYGVCAECRRNAKGR